MNPDYRHGYEDAANDMSIAFLALQKPYRDREYVSISEFITLFNELRAPRFNNQEVSTETLKYILNGPQ